MLTGWKASFLTFKCVFYRPELNVKREPMELNFESLEIKHANRESLKNR